MPTAKGTKVWTVSIYDTEDADMDIWTAVFSSFETANAYMIEVEKKMVMYGLVETLKVTIDSDYVDEGSYLDWIDDRYSEI